MRLASKVVVIVTALAISAVSLLVPLLGSWLNDAWRVNAQVVYAQATPRPFAFVRKPDIQLANIIGLIATEYYDSEYYMDATIAEDISNESNERTLLAFERMDTLYTQCGIDEQCKEDYRLGYINPIGFDSKLFQTHVYESQRSKVDKYGNYENVVTSRIMVDDYSNAVMGFTVGQDMGIYDEIKQALYADESYEEIVQAAYDTADKYSYNSELYELASLLICPAGLNIDDVVGMKYESLSEIFGMEWGSSALAAIDNYVHSVESMLKQSDIGGILGVAEEAVKLFADDALSPTHHILEMLEERLGIYYQYGIDELRTYVNEGSGISTGFSPASAAVGEIQYEIANADYSDAAALGEKPYSYDLMSEEAEEMAELLPGQESDYDTILTNNTLYTEELSELIRHSLLAALPGYPELTWLINEPVPQQSMLTWAGYTLDASAQPECRLTKDHSAIILRYPSIQHMLALDVYIQAHTMTLIIVPE